MRLLPLCFAALAGVTIAGSAMATPAAAPPAPHEFIDDAKALLVVGACAEGTAPINAEVYEAHCKKVHAAQQDYKTKWLAAANEFFRANVPATIPKIVVYPFAGGDLATALTVFPDADEITTISLEPAGDPRALTRLGDKRLRTPLGVVATELSSLYRYNYSKTMNMIDAMRVGQLPTQLIFSLSALGTHGYEPTAMRYFELTSDGDIRYLTDDDLAALDKVKDVKKLNTALANVELKFKKPGGREQVYRHIMANLNDAHLRKFPAVLAHLTKKGRVSAMTKAASYLLTFSEFKTMRTYLAEHVDWMVSDSTGLPPAQGIAAGFEYETWGTYERSNMKEGASVTPSWKKLYAAQPKRSLAFRFGYPDGALHDHLIIMRKPPPT
jgi:hypothetical protein